jgi:hypothetical protein
MQPIVRLTCVPEGKKLRVRIVTYVDEDGKEYDNVYNPEYNCRFPRDLRVLNVIYEVPAAAVRLQTSKNGVHSYSVNTSTIKVNSSIPQLVYTEPTCVICLENSSNIIFQMCGHMCTCCECSEKLDNTCPICRATIICKIKRE